MAGRPNAATAIAADAGGDLQRADDRERVRQSGAIKPPGMSSMGKLLALSLVCTLAAAVLFQPVLWGRRARFATIDRANENRAWRKGSRQGYPAAAGRMHVSRVIPPTRANVSAQRQSGIWSSHRTSRQGCGSTARRMHIRRCFR